MMKFDLLGTLLAGAEPPLAGGERHQVLFQPSFHRESLLTIELLPDAATVHLRVFTDSLWGALAGNADLRDTRSPADSPSWSPSCCRHTPTTARPSAANAPRSCATTSRATCPA